MIIGLIPARYQSSRLPGKPLLKFGSETMIQKVYKQTCLARHIDKVYVLTDDDRVADSIRAIGGNVLIVTQPCINGTERICHALKDNGDLFKDATYIVNVQGDEPFINPEHIDLAIAKMKQQANERVKCATLHYRIDKLEDLTNTSIGKLVLDKNDHIRYCSRNCIPYNKMGKPDITKEVNYYGHIGLFVFDLNYLKQHYLGQNYPLQLEEDIEWLKLLEQGYDIVSVKVDNYEIGVNLPEDYDYLTKKYALSN